MHFVYMNYMFGYSFRKIFQDKFYLLFFLLIIDIINFEIIFQRQVYFREFLTAELHTVQMTSLRNTG